VSDDLKYLSLDSHPGVFGKSKKFDFNGKDFLLHDVQQNIFIFHSVVTLEQIPGGGNMSSEGKNSCFLMFKTTSIATVLLAWRSKPQRT
jgi:hypothetical protein